MRFEGVSTQQLIYIVFWRCLSYVDRCGRQYSATYACQTGRNYLVFFTTRYGRLNVAEARVTKRDLNVAAACEFASEILT